MADAALAESGLSRKLAAFVAGSRLDAVPEQVREHAIRAILNGFGTALGGSGDQAIVRLADAFGAVAAGGTHVVIGRSAPRDMQTATFLNAASMNVLDFDDTHIPTIIHPTAPVVPAVFALAGHRGATGAEALHAAILGIEIACRLGNAVSPGHYARGWHITATCGIFGAAAACAKLLGLDEERIVWAFGNASAQASGLVETLGFMAKSVGVGGAARDGLMAALMAAAGVEGPPQPIEGPRGFLRVTCDTPMPERAAQDLAGRWEILRNMFKPYPCGVVLNPVIDACLALRTRGNVAATEIATVRVRGNPLLKARADRPAVTTGREAQVSAQHAVAVSLLRGAAGAAEFSDAAVADPEVRALRAKVVAVEADDRMPVEAAELRIELVTGQVIEIVEETATGSLERPMDDAALKAKFRSLAAHGCPGLDHVALERALWCLPDLPDAASVLGLARGPSSGTEQHR